jgi:hypothetical protein
MTIVKCPLVSCTNNFARECNLEVIKLTTDVKCFERELPYCTNYLEKEKMK